MVNSRTWFISSRSSITEAVDNKRAWNLAVRRAWNKMAYKKSVRTTSLVVLMFLNELKLKTRMKLGLANSASDLFSIVLNFRVRYLFLTFRCHFNISRHLQHHYPLLGLMSLLSFSWKSQKTFCRSILCKSCAQKTTTLLGNSSGVGIEYVHFLGTVQICSCWNRQLFLSHTDHCI